MKTFFSKIKWRNIFAAFILFSLVPFPTELIPEWKMQFVDENNQPLPNIGTVQSWENYTFYSVEGIDYRCTDNSGIVVYPKRFLWAGLISRIISPPWAKILTLAHGSTGTRASVQVFDKNYTSDYRYWRDGDKLQTIVVAKRITLDNARQNCEK